MGREKRIRLLVAEASKRRITAETPLLFDKLFSMARSMWPYMTEEVWKSYCLAVMFRLTSCTPRVNYPERHTDPEGAA